MQVKSSGSEKANEVTVSKGTQVSAVYVDPFSRWIDGDVTHKALLHLATQFSQSDLVPKAFQGKPANCFIGLQIAHRAKGDPYEIIQNLNVIHGTPTFKSKYLIARANESGVFIGRLQFETKQDSKNGLTVTCSAKLAETGKVVSMSASMAMAEAEGWAKSNPKYRTMPEVMLGYRAASFLVSRHAPEIALGLPTYEEIEDVNLVETKTRDRSKSGSAAALNERIETINAEAVSQVETENQKYMEDSPL